MAKIKKTNQNLNPFPFGHPFLLKLGDVTKTWQVAQCKMLKHRHLEFMDEH